MISLTVFLTFFLFSLGQLGRISFNQGRVNFYLYEVVLFLQLILFFFRLKFEPVKKTFSRFKIIYYFFFFLAFSFVVNAFNYKINENAVALLYLLRLILYAMFPLYFYFFIKKNPQLKNGVKTGVNLLFLLVALFAIVQYFLYPDLRNLYYLGWDPHLNRLFSVFFDTAVAASVFGLIFFYLYQNKRYLISLLFLSFLVLTFSRSAYIFFAATFLVGLFLNKNLKYGLLVLLFSLVIFLLAPKQFGLGVGLDRMFSISSRAVDYEKGIAMWKKSPIIGHGYNRLAYVKERMNLKEKPKEDFPVHSAASLSGSFLIILVTSGIVGLILFLVSLINLAGISNLTLYVLFLGLMSLTDNIFLHPFILFLFGALAVVSLPSGKSQPKS